VITALLLRAAEMADGAAAGELPPLGAAFDALYPLVVGDLQALKVILLLPSDDRHSNALDRSHTKDETQEPTGTAGDAQARVEAPTSPEAADAARALVPVGVIRALLPNATKEQRETVRGLLASVA
jgi:hypothetical protein